MHVSRRMRWLFGVGGLAVVLAVRVGWGATPRPLKSFRSCVLVPTDWADGDSFRVRTATGKTFTVRLYGVDCLEYHLRSDSDVRRLRAQRRYFGISEAGGSPKASVALAREYARKATERVRTLLAKPFTVWTAFTDGRGSSRYRRYYAFVVTADGRDLAEVLVSEGLARAYGVCRETPDGVSAREYRARLKDLELQAALRRVGIWETSDPVRLPEERRLQREDDAEYQQILDMERAPRPVDPNTADRSALMRLPGIGQVMAERILADRRQGAPYRKPEDLLRVPGIGEKTLEHIRRYLVFNGAARQTAP